MNDDILTRTDATTEAGPDTLRGASPGAPTTMSGRDATTLRNIDAGAARGTDDRDAQRAEHERERDEKKREHEREREEKKRRESEPQPAIAAIFGSREEARQAISALHKAHFKKTWFGVTSLASDSHGGETITAESGGAGGFFSETTSLVDALVAHGLLGDVARRIESRIEPGDSVLTVRLDDQDPNEALEVLSRFGGDVETSGMGPMSTTSAARTARVPSMRGDVSDTPGDEALIEEEMFYARRR